MESSVRCRVEFRIVYYDAIDASIIPVLNWTYNYYWVFE
jgi:hypothetical protein